jgi:hypothetical protein
VISNLKVGTYLVLQEEKYCIVGIDHYSLINLYQGKKSWLSFTIANDSKRVSFSFTDGQFIFWQQGTYPLDDVNINNFQEKFILNWQFSGIAQIKFEGDMGGSQPWAELVWFQNKTCQDIFLLERFFNTAGESCDIDPYKFEGKFLNPKSIIII